MTATFEPVDSGSAPGRPWRDWSQVAGHASPVTCLAWSAARQWLVSGGYDGYVICWDGEDAGRPRWSRRFGDLVNALSIDRDSRQLAVAVGDSYAYLLDLDSGIATERLGPHGDDVNDIAWDPSDSSRLVLCCEMADPHVRLWEQSATGWRSRDLGPHPEGAFALSYADTGMRIVTGSDDAVVRVWNLATGELEVALPHPAATESVRFAPGGEQLATGCLDGQLRIWQFVDGEWILGWAAADTKVSVRNVGFSPSGRAVFAGSYDGHLRLYDTESHQLTESWTGPLQWERAAVMPDEDTVWVGSFGSRPVLRRRGAAHDAGAAVACHPTWGVNVLTATPDGGVLAGSDCGFVGTLGSRPLAELETLITGLAVDGDRGLTAVTDYLGRLFVFDRTGSVSATATTDGGPLNAVLWCDDGSLLAGGYDGVLRRWTADCLPMGSTIAHGGQVKALASLAERGCVVSVSADSTAAAWRIGDEVVSAGRLDAEGIVLINGVGAARKGRSWVALASRDRSVRLWDPAGGIVSTFPAVHAKSVKAIAVSPDGSLIVTGGYDGLVVFWQLDEADRLLGWHTHALHGKPGVSSTAITEDAVFSAGWDGSIAQWTHQGTLVNQYVPLEP